MNLVHLIDEMRSLFAVNSPLVLSQNTGLPSGLLLDLSEQEAIVSEAILPARRGRVRFQGSWWFARCMDRTVLAPGETVRVVGCRNLTLLVERC